MEQFFLSLKAKSTVLTAVLPDEEGNLRIRLCELEGRDDLVALRFASPVASAVTTDLLGHEIPADIRLSGNEVALTVKKNSLTQLRIAL